MRRRRKTQHIIPPGAKSQIHTSEPARTGPNSKPEDHVMRKSRKRRRYHPQRHSRQMSQSLHRSSEIVIEGWNTETKLSSFHSIFVIRRESKTKAIKKAQGDSN